MKATAAAAATVVQQQVAGQPSSRYVGVRWMQTRRRWAAEISHEGRRQHLGTFAEEEAAARAFDDAARRLRGDKAHGERGRWRLNFPTGAERGKALEALAGKE